MKVLVIGSGGREHAIAYKLKQSPKVTELYAIPGNPGIASLGTCVPGSVEDNEFIVDFIKKNQIDLTVIGPEVPLCKGLADDIEKAGYKAFGPQKKAATLEGSKAYSKDFMVRHHIPTAKYVEVTDFEKACKEVAEMSIKKLYEVSGYFADYDLLVVTGGTGAAWIKYFEEILSGMEGLEIIPGNHGNNLPIYLANVRGYYMTAYRKLKKAGNA